MQKVNRFGKENPHQMKNIPTTVACVASVSAHTKTFSIFDRARIGAAKIEKETLATQATTTADRKD